MIPSKEENPNGLHRKYDIRRTDGKPIPEDAEFFILRLDKGSKNLDHLRACKKALAAYCNSIQYHLPKLAADLRKRYLQDAIEDTSI